MPAPASAPRLKWSFLAGSEASGWAEKKAHSRVLLERCPPGSLSNEWRIMIVFATYPARRRTNDTHVSKLHKAEARDQHLPTLRVHGLDSKPCSEHGVSAKLARYRH